VIVSPRRFGQAIYERRLENLIYLAAPKATITAGDYSSEHQICQLGFSRRDGTIFLSFPYLKFKSGILSAVRFPSDQSGSITFSLAESGKVTSHLAKLSHHPDGQSHFSQDGRLRTEVKRPSFRLTGPIGHLFHFTVYFPREFETFDSARRKLDRPYLRYRFQSGLPDGLQVSAEWRHKKDIIECIQPAGKDSGPITQVKHKQTGAESTVFFFGQPEGFPLQDHVIMLSVGPVAVPTNVSEATIILMAGYDPHEVENSGDPVTQSGCLCAMYPLHHAEELLERLGTVDFSPP
jgi:hypothetical protein